MTHKNLYLLIGLMALAMLSGTGCIEDGITTSASDQPDYSTDTLKLGELFTDEPSPTYSFKVYNRHSKVLSISSITLRDNKSDVFRLNVDGMAGTQFSNVEIRPNDSIFVFVAATLPTVGSFDRADVEDAVVFNTNGVTSEVAIVAVGRDIERHHGLVIASDTHWAGDRPRQIFDSLVVAPGATLTIGEGAELYFHDKSDLRVRGRLVCEGSAERPVMLTGDKRGNVITDVSFDLMSRQWEGVRFYPESGGSRMSFTTVQNTWRGVEVDSVYGSEKGNAALSLMNCRLRNSHGYVLSSRHSTVEASGCELADAGSGVVLAVGGDLTLNHCTVANYYLFSAIGGAAIQLHHLNADSSDEGAEGLPYLKGEITNCVIYGSSGDMTPGVLDDTDVYVRRSIVRSTGEDDEHFTDILWGADPLYYTVRSEYIFDYRPQENSPAIGASFSGYDTMTPATDYYGRVRPVPATLGAFEPKAGE